MIISAYSPVVRRVERQKKTFKNWTDTSIGELQSCFELTNWDLFLSDSLDLNDQVIVVSSYINFCVELIIPTKSLTVFPNNKPWVTKELKNILNNEEKSIFVRVQWGEKKINKEVKRTIRCAKLNYKNKIENKFVQGDMRAVWHGIKNMADISIPKQGPVLNKDVDGNVLVNDLNLFFTRFEKHDSSAVLDDFKQKLSPSNSLNLQPLNVIKQLKATPVNKAPGPDGICGRTLKYCAEQLSVVFHSLFQASLDQAVVPCLWKTSNIIPIPKQQKSHSLHDFRPIALTSLAMKALEREVKSQLITVTGHKLDSLQFAYRTKRGVDDAKLFLLNTIHQYLEKGGTFARMLFVDFSSAFNTMNPIILAKKLVCEFDVSHGLVLWILDFLTCRQQRVKLNGVLSDTLVTSIGSPQGCVLSSIFFILYTNECRSTKDNCHVVKYADDTVFLSLLTSAECDDSNEHNEFFEWCKTAELQLNISKTKEMVIDFRKNASKVKPVYLYGKEVERVQEYKYLGTIFDTTLKFQQNTEFIIKKVNQRMYVLRKLNSFCVQKKILRTFYTTFIESVLSFSFLCWYSSLSLRNKNRLQTLVRTCSKIIGVPLRCLAEFYKQQMLRKTRSITGDDSHPLKVFFEVLPSGRRFRSIKCSSNRYKFTFVPEAIRFCNSKS